MAKVSLAYVDKAAVVAPPDDAQGAVETRALFNRDSDSIHLYVHRVAPGGRVSFAAAQTDRLFYVWHGAAATGGATLQARSSAIAEFGTSIALTAGSEGATLLEFHMRERGLQERDGGHVHLLPNERVPRTDHVNGKHLGMALHADSQCPTCQVWLHENDFFTSADGTELHSHSEDEVIFVRDGSIRLGNRVHGPGTAIAIAANTKYSFLAGPDGLSFVNFRGTAPTYVKADGSMTVDEGELWRARVGAPSYLEPLSP